MQALISWLLVAAGVFGVAAVGLFIALITSAVMTWLDRLPRQQEPRNAPRTRQQLCRPGAGEERRDGA